MNTPRIGITPHSRIRGWSLLTVTLAIVIMLVLSACRGQQEGPISEEAAIAGGRASFQAYCASCHGRDGMGGGPVASQLTIAPTDLTTLSARFDGSFPGEYVLRIIDGREEFLAHGSRTMPVWGNIWRYDEDDPKSEAEALRVMHELSMYLESIQGER